MSKLKKLKKRLTAFASQLTPDECREQLVLSYLQMERCQQVLRGEDVEPVTQMDNGESSDLELFYLCKKVREELDLLNRSEKNPKGESITIGVDVDCSDAIKHFKDFKKEFEKLHSDAVKHINNYCKPRKDVYVMKVDLEKYFPPISIDTGSHDSMLAFHKMMIDAFSLVDQLPKNMTLPVYFMYHGRIHKNKCAQWIGVSEGKKLICKIDGYDGVFNVSDIYQTPDEVVMSVGKVVSDHVSLSRDKKQSFFIDHTNRVFRGAEWYLEDQKIDHFDTLDELRKFLLENIIDDGKEE